MEGLSNLFAMEIDPKIDTEQFKLPNTETDKATKDFLSELINNVPGIDEAMSFS